jgi:hypothetical protein
MSNGRCFPIVNFNEERNVLPYQQRQKIIQGYGQMLGDRVENGWCPFLLTFLFKQLPGNSNFRIEQMIRHISIFYSKLVTRIQRYPATMVGSANVPILVTCTDLPIAKHKKRSLPEVSINDGLHLHGLFALPPISRIGRDLQSHLFSKRHVYETAPLIAVHSEPIHSDFHGVVGYALKSFRSGRINYDDSIFILPRTFSELK